MSKIPQTCGYGRRKTHFGDNLAATGSNIDSFFQPGTADSLHLKPGKCLGTYNQPTLTRFGKKKQFIQEAFRSFEKKGTKGSFIRWCKSHGYPKVTTACINRGKKSKSALTRKRAIFAQNIHSKKRTYTFGKKTKKKFTLNTLNKDIKYLKGI
jgi:hypothetical protein